MDELLWAALWLYKATHKEVYLEYVLKNGEGFGGTTWAMKEFSWDVKYAGLQIIASMVRFSPSCLFVIVYHFSKMYVKSPFLIFTCRLAVAGRKAQTAQADTTAVPLKRRALHMCLP